MTNRVVHVDIAKGISIILVALFHSKIYPFAPDCMNAMGLFRMPLFFFLSGVFFNASMGANVFLWKKSDALLKPYFATLLVVFVFAVLHREEHLIRQLIGIFYGNGVTIPPRWVPMWFLTHLFLIYAFTYFIFRITNVQSKNVFFKYILILILMVIGTQWIDVFWNLEITLFGTEIIMPGLPFGIDIVLVSASFFISGAFLREKVIHFIPNVYLLICSVLMFLLVTMFTDAHMDLNRRVYSNPFFTTAGSMAGIYAVICIAYYLSKTKKIRNIFLTFGQASLFVLIFHVFIGSNVYGYLMGLETESREMLFAVFAFIISISVPLLIKYFVLKNRIVSFFYCPVKIKNTTRM
ncbi:acetyltransferase, fucose-4-O-acetylase [Desulfocapsa sulfexigens DSM 10523]|uniref:Acetyltransferase, fucose-4-O-acetylase n=1 Tax=Desulfocapsa sulfexigens (strain DSM 10523 / SB164P1) TaxID=1167006 RepID=M1PFS3_DESSD|nr:acyltransferase family protein [Desulfocapsa sulfexigens]AGF78515.1 acetyltransferase, fucose-4-O-acetylase [Desulfocapsa sulfexigens DSM 10523]